MIAKLSEADVRRLLNDPSPDSRADAAAKIATHYDAAADFAEHEKKLAEEIFSIMCKDAEVRVRQALASNLKDCPFLPREIALDLAHDVDAVSVPMLTYSTVLSEEDLIEIVRSQGEEKQKAIASRASVSEGLSDALIDTNNETVVGTLVANNGAEISTPSMQRVLDEFGDSDLVKNGMVNRPFLPVEVTERLMTMVSVQLQQQLITRHELSAEQISDLILQSREKATLNLVRNNHAREDARRLIIHLYKNGRLPTIVLRALCMGDMEFFEGSTAVLARIPLTETRKIIHRGKQEEIASLLQKADLPQALQPAFSAAIQVAAETELDGGERDQERFQRRMIERIITNFEHPDAAMGDDNIEYLLAKLSRIDAGFSLNR